MKKTNICITGILGYISREICELLKDNPNYNIYGFDNRFLPETVKWLSKNKIQYYERDIFDSEDLIKRADIVIHTAGETAVPQTLQQSTPEKNSLITKIGTGGTKEIISNLKESAHLLFFSTHVIFEGLNNPEFQNIDENFAPCPVLAYGTSKRDSELDIKNSCKKYNILRLASVYGDNPNIRYSILPNLFSKKTALNQDLTVFGTGSNIKPLVGINDVARFVHFLILNQEFHNQTYNVVNEHKTVKEIAEICQKNNKNISIKFSNDPIINNGYGLKKDKILSTGFKFKQNLETEIEKMIKNWRVND